MTVTTTDIERVAKRVGAEIVALTACAPAHADMIAAAVLARVERDLVASGTGGRIPRSPAALARARPEPVS